MGTGHQDLRSFRRILDLHNVQLDALCGLEHLAFYLLVLRQHGVRLAQVDADVLPDIALNDTGHDILLFLKILVVDDLPLLLADLLKDQVLGVLCGDTAKGFGLHRNLDHIAQLILAVNVLCVLKADLLHLVFHFLHDRLLLEKLVVACLSVHDDLDIVCLSEMVLARIDERILNGIHQRILADVLLLLQNIQRFQ